MDTKSPPTLIGKNKKSDARCALAMNSAAKVLPRCGSDVPPHFGGHGLGDKSAAALWQRLAATIRQRFAFRGRRV